MEEYDYVVPLSDRFRFDERDLQARAVAYLARETLPRFFQPYQNVIRLKVVPRDQLPVEYKKRGGSRIKAHKIGGFYYANGAGYRRVIMPSGRKISLPTAEIVLGGTYPVDIEIDRITHEFGHHLYYRLCSKADRDRWREIWRVERSSYPKRIAYGKDDSMEAFAGVFSLWVRGHPGVGNQSRRFFEDVSARLKRFTGYMPPEKPGKPQTPSAANPIAAIQAAYDAKADAFTRRNARDWFARYPAGVKRLTASGEVDEKAPYTYHLRWFAFTRSGYYRYAIQSAKVQGDRAIVTVKESSETTIELPQKGRWLFLRFRLQGVSSDVWQQAHDGRWEIARSQEVSRQVWRNGVLIPDAPVKKATKKSR